MLFFAVDIHKEAALFDLSGNSLKTHRLDAPGKGWGGGGAG